MMLPFDPASFSQPSEESNRTNNLLRHYLFQQSPEDLAKIAQSITPEAQQMMMANIQSLLGALPSERFDVQISANRDNLAGLLASAMMTGYFLRRVEQRMELERQLAAPTEDTP